MLFTRDFQFRFDDRARQDIQLFISDWAPSRDKQFRLSELMNSVLHFFPRNYLPAIFGSEARYIVTLPTGEQVEFDAKTREILGGVFSETAVDLNPDRAARKFPGVNYLGKGVVVRANSRGTRPDESATQRRSPPERRLRIVKKGLLATNARFRPKNFGIKMARFASSFPRTRNLIATCYHAADLAYPAPPSWLFHAGNPNQNLYNICPRIDRSQGAIAQRSVLKGVKAGVKKTALLRFYEVRPLLLLNLKPFRYYSLGAAR